MIHLKKSGKVLINIMMLGSLLFFFSCSEPTDADSPVLFKEIKTVAHANVKTPILKLDTVVHNGIPCLQIEVRAEKPTPEILMKAPAAAESGAVYDGMRIQLRDPSGTLIPLDSHMAMSMTYQYNQNAMDQVAAYEPKKNKGLFSSGYEPTSFYLPMTIFHKIPAGQRTFQLDLEMVQFGYERIKDTATGIQQTVMEIFPIPDYFKRSVSFELNVPKIYVSYLECSEFTIDDAAFNSKWDVRLFGPGEPDGMWTLAYPQHNWPMYFSSSHHKNRQKCGFNGGVRLYHLKPQSPVGIYFFDYDLADGNDMIDFSEFTLPGSLNGDTVTIQNQLPKISDYQIKVSTQEAN